MPRIGHDPEFDLHQKRKTMTAWRRAIKQTLMARPASDSPTIGALYPDAESLFHAIEAHVSTLPVDNPIRRGWEDISEYERLHPDAVMVRETLGVTDEWFDTLFLDAKAKEAAA